MRYIALTLGPITRTIELAENTRGIWAASYIFSYLGKNIIRPFKNRSFLLPKISDEMFAEGKFCGAGIFPDRYIFKSEDGDFSTLSEQVEKVFDQLASDMTPVINKLKEEKDVRLRYKIVEISEVKKFIRGYFKVYFFEKDFEEKMGDNDIKKSCEKSLSLLEMQDSIVPVTYDKESILYRFFSMVTSSFLAIDAGLNKGFPSIVEITSDSFKPKHPYEKYIAIVKADGDSMGKAFERVSDANSLSDALFDFNVKAAKKIEDFEGMPVYIGGDDLLFFAPIFNKKSIFSLLQDLDDLFHRCIDEKSSLKSRSTHPTLSFGVSISYYKYPMLEALDTSGFLLRKAKGYDAPANVEKVLKDNILFSVQKHSGQTRASLIHKGNTKTLSAINQFLDKYLARDGQSTLLTSVMHGLRDRQALLTIAVKDNVILSNFFDNNFNEDVHKKNKSFFDDIKELMRFAYEEYKETGKLESLKYSMPEMMKKEGLPSAEVAAIETVYNTLQFIHLVNQRNDA